jgi:hypothetical protein
VNTANNPEKALEKIINSVTEGSQPRSFMNVTSTSKGIDDWRGR